MKKNMPKQTAREPWLAVNLSMILSGLGHLYAGFPLRGWGLLLSQLLLPLFGLILIALSWNESLVWVGVGCLLFSFVLFVVGLFDAFHRVKAQDSQDFESARTKHKDPWRAAFFSRLLMGLGHLYVGQIPLGLFLLLVSLLSFVYPLLAIFGFLAAPFFMYQAYKAAPVRRETSNKLIVMVSIISCIVSPLLGLFFAFTLRLLVLEARYIPSGAMEPAINVNDRLIVDKFSYRFSEPQRGDIVVFQPTEPLRQMGFKDPFINRIVGMPGETVAIRNNRLVVNGQPLPEPYLMSGELTRVEACNNSNAYLVRPQTIPAGSYLVLGDNRQNSFDGRCWGLISRSDIIGKATRRFWPLEHWGLLNSER
jgi:signal peptidase I